MGSSWVVGCFIFIVTFVSEIVASCVVFQGVDKKGTQIAMGIVCGLVVVVIALFQFNASFKLLQLQKTLVGPLKTK